MGYYCEKNKEESDIFILGLAVVILFINDYDNNSDTMIKIFIKAIIIVIKTKVVKTIA